MNRAVDRLLILYESEAACIQRLSALGISGDAAAEVAHYLAQATDLAAFYGRIESAFARVGTAVSFFEIGQAPVYLPLMWQNPARTLLWNLTDGFRYYSASFVTSAAALLGVRTLGSPPQAQHLCQDKYKCLALARSAGVRTPPTALLDDGAFVTPPFALPAGQAYFVKPNTLGSKIGIYPESRCASHAEAQALSRRIAARYRDRAVLQAYVPGYDVRVSFMAAAGEASRPGIYRIGVAGKTAVDGAFFTMEDNWTWAGLRSAAEAGVPSPSGRQAAFQIQTQDLRQAAQLDSAAARVVAEVETAVERMRRLMGLRNVFSFDFRVGDDGQVYFLEFEVCPAVTTVEFQVYLEESYGVGLPEALVRLAGASEPDSR